MTKQRILALDLGERRIGVAISDALHIIAQPLETIERENLTEDIKKIKTLVSEYNISRVIVGLPLNMNGSKGLSAQTALGFAEYVKEELGVKVEMVDERLTTSQAERALLEADMSRKKRKKHIDKLAAQMILQAYLDAHIK